jgi:hypothetical protein
MHAVGEVQETLDMEPPVAPVGIGVVWTVHLVPFQNSLKDPKVPALVS